MITLLVVAPSPESGQAVPMTITQLIAMFAVMATFMGLNTTVLVYFMNAKFSAVDARFDAVDAKFDAVDAKFDAIDAKFDARFDSVEFRLAEIEKAMPRKLVP